jgi:hypothetical protein
MADTGVVVSNAMADTDDMPVNVFTDPVTNVKKSVCASRARTVSRVQITRWHVWLRCSYASAQ